MTPIDQPFTASVHVRALFTSRVNRLLVHLLLCRFIVKAPIDLEQEGACLKLFSLTYVVSIGGGAPPAALPTLKFTKGLEVRDGSVCEDNLVR